MQTHPSLIERSVGATLCAFARGRIGFEEAHLDLTELVATQIVGKTPFSIAAIGYYVRAVLKALMEHKVALADVFDALVDAAAVGSEDHRAVTLRLAEPLRMLKGSL